MSVTLETKDATLPTTVTGAAVEPQPDAASQTAVAVGETTSGTSEFSGSTSISAAEPSVAV